MGSIQDELDAFEQMKSRLEAECLGQWVLIFDRRLVSTYDSFESAASEAVARFGGGPFLIKKVGAPPITLPVSVMYYRPDANG